MSGEFTTHIRRDGAELNADAVMLCGLTFVELQAAGDKYFFEGESHHAVTCEKCLGRPPKSLGTPLDRLSGRPGHDGYEEFCRIARSWGFDR